MACSSLADEALVIVEESKKDDEVDADGDGKADVKQIGNREYALRKTRLVMAKMNPEKVDSAVASIYKVWLAVAAVLKIQFARTINMALGIAEFINKPVDRFLRPTIQIIVPDEYDRWVPVVLSWITKSIAMSVAWYIQTVISAATSAMQGGLQMARALMRMGRKRGVKFLPADHETYIDEVAAYIFAGLGFYFQFSLHFDVPFPFNWLLWPFELAGEFVHAAFVDFVVCTVQGCACTTICTHAYYYCSCNSYLNLLMTIISVLVCYSVIHTAAMQLTSLFPNQ